MTGNKKKMNNSQLSQVNRNLHEKRSYTQIFGRRDNESGVVVVSPASILSADIKFAVSEDSE